MSAREPVRWKVRNAYSFLDMLVGVLCEHEKRLSDLIGSLAGELELATEARRKVAGARQERSGTERDETVLRYYESL